jgi:asparagine synthase (glutamine-hydrolysing)
VVIGAQTNFDAGENKSAFEIEHEMMLLDSLHYLHDDILVKVDRASMSTGLEARAPFLDKRVAAFAWRLPLEWKIQGGVGKWILRQVLYRYVPKTMVDRPKRGFGVPLDRWLRSELRDWAESLLDPSRLRREAIFHPAPIRKKWDEHISGHRNWAFELWDILMFQSWLENSRNPVVAPEGQLVC